LSEPRTVKHKIRRRCKIVATLGPATDDASVLAEIIQAGVDVVRVNFSHGTAEEQISRAIQTRQIAQRLGRHVAVLADLQGPKIRIRGFVEHRVELADGAGFILDTRLGAQAGTQQRVGVTYKTLPQDVKPGNFLMLDDGNICLQVVAVDDHEINTLVVTGGVLSDSKGINLQGGGLSAPALTAKDLTDIKTAAAMEADYLAVSFPRTAADVQQARELFRAAGGKGGIVAKVERSEAVTNIEEIIRASEAVMIARGDLGVEIGDAELPGVQKTIINRCRSLNRIVITATQMMQSMVENPQPTRAEVMDVANAVIDGTDAVMLSAETAVGRYPQKVIESMARICVGAEKQRRTLVSNHRMTSRFDTIEESIAMASMYTANHMDVSAILALTESGTTARLMSRISSGIPIFAMTRHPEVGRRVSLYRGVYAVDFDANQVPVGLVNRTAVAEMQRLGAVQKDDLVLVTKGDLSGIAGGTNSLKIVRVGEVF